MTEVVTYYSSNAKPKEQWLAYAVLPDGSQWLVRCAGETEEIAKGKAIRLYEAERAKFKAQEPELKKDGFTDNNPWPVQGDGRGHHFAGKKWVMNIATREKLRLDEAEAASRVAAGGWAYAGPRTK